MESAPAGLAVRSSGVGEDTEVNSFAGVYTSDGSLLKVIVVPVSINRPDAAAYIIQSDTSMENVEALIHAPNTQGLCLCGQVFLLLHPMRPNHMAEGYLRVPTSHGAPIRAFGE